MRGTEDGFRLSPGHPNKRQRSHIDCANERKKEELKMSKEKVTASMIELWIGEGFDRRNRFQNTALESCFSILASVANGKYSVEELRENILSNNVSLK